tara:strand:- start:1278 stop:1958 length:681 start_codon:yes stop_codon:yes gene_type:complete
MTSLTVIVPVFNEEETVQESLSRLDSVDIISRVIIVDDCSTDNSNTLIKDFIQDKNKYLLLKTNHNSGKGKAIEIAQDYIETDYLAIHDADLEYFPEDFYSMYEKIENNNLVLGSRFIGNLIRNNLYSRTLFANYFLSKLFSFIYRNKVTDVASCYKMIPTDFFKKIKIESSGFEFEIEVLAKYLNENNKISEVPINYSGRSYAEGKKIKSIDGFKYIYWMFKCKK